jgi:multiple antibiotic resistance protein
VLTTTILLIDQYGMVPTVSATIVNIVIAGMLFWMSGSINRILGRAGIRTISKLSSLILAAIGVMMVRKAIMQLIAAGASFVS